MIFCKCMYSYLIIVVVELPIFILKTWKGMGMSMGNDLTGELVWYMSIAIVYIFTLPTEKGQYCFPVKHESQTIWYVKSGKHN